MAAGLNVNKALMGGQQDQCGQGSVLPLGDNQPTHSVGQDSSKGQKRAPEKRKSR